MPSLATIVSVSVTESPPSRASVSVSLLDSVYVQAPELSVIDQLPYVPVKVDVPPLLAQLVHVQVTASPSASVTVMVSVAVSVVPVDASVTDPVSSESAMTGASFCAATVTVAARVTVTESSFLLLTHGHL